MDLNFASCCWNDVWNQKNIIVFPLDSTYSVEMIVAGKLRKQSVEAILKISTEGMF